MSCLVLPIGQGDTVPRLLGVAIAAGGHGNIHDAGAHGVEVDDLLIVLAARLFAVEDLAHLGVNILVLHKAVTPHQRHGADHAMLDTLPVVHHQLIGAADAVVIHLEVRHIHHQRTGTQPLALDKGLESQRDAVDDIALAHRLLHIGGGDHLQAGVGFHGVFGKALRRLGTDIVGVDGGDGTHHHGRRQLGHRLGAAAADGHDGGVALGQIVDSHAAGSAGAHGADGSTVGDADGQLGVRVVENDGDAGPGQTLLEVHGAAADPLDAGHVILAADITGHGVDAAHGVLVLHRLTPAHNALARGDDIPLVRQAVDLLHITDHRCHIGSAAAIHSLIVQKENIDTLNAFSMGDFHDGIIRISQLMKLRYGVVDGTIKYADFISNWFKYF